MQLLKFLTFFFLLFPIGTFAQFLEERTPFSDFSLTENSVELPSFQWQSDFLYREMYSFYDHSLFMPSGDLLSNIFTSNYQRDGGIDDVNPPQLGEPNSGIPRIPGYL